MMHQLLADLRCLHSQFQKVWNLEKSNFELEAPTRYNCLEKYDNYFGTSINTSVS